VRSAAVLGIVGAGGIGVSLYQSFRAFEYQEVCAIMIILIVTVAIIDTISAKTQAKPGLATPTPHSLFPPELGEVRDT
jgi:phosphonate transport system permease protein